MITTGICLFIVAHVLMRVFGTGIKGAHNAGDIAGAVCLLLSYAFMLVGLVELVWELLP